MKWFSTLRGRAGVAVDNAMFYLTGGLALAEFEQAWDEQNSLQDASFSGNAKGWVTGLGVEFAPTAHSSIKIETLRLSFGERSDFIATDPRFPFHAKNETNVIRAGWNFKF